MKKRLAIMAAAMMALAVVGCSKTTENTTDTPKRALVQMEMPAEGEEIAVFTTNYGEIKVRLFPQYAPKAVENFVTHAKNGYYDGVTFHRVINEFMIQSGDPTGTGRGGENIWNTSGFETEISPYMHLYKGALAMANRGLDTNGSQFFIVQQNDANSTGLIDMLREAVSADDGSTLELQGEEVTFSDIYSEDVLTTYEEVGGAPHLEFVFGSSYTVFGQVIEGMDVVDTIAKVEVETTADGQENKPIEDVIIEKLEIVPYAAK